MPCCTWVALKIFEPNNDASPVDEAGSDDSADSRRRRGSTAKRKPASGYNPFEEDPGEEPAAAPPKKRRYRKDPDYNPFGDVPQDEVPDPVGDGFEFGIETPPPAATSAPSALRSRLTSR